MKENSRVRRLFEVANLLNSLEIFRTRYEELKNKHNGDVAFVKNFINTQDKDFDVTISIRAVKKGNPSALDTFKQKSGWWDETDVQED